MDLESSPELKQMLRRIPIFGGLSNETLSFLIKHANEVNVPNGQHFFHESDQANSLFVLISGNVAIEKKTDDGEVNLRTLQAGDCFGEMAIVDLEPRSASVRACADCHALEISRGNLMALFQHSLEQYAIIMMNMGREVSRRLRTINPPPLSKSN